jgi:hypothetical protein
LAQVALFQLQQLAAVMVELQLSTLYSLRLVAAVVEQMIHQLELTPEQMVAQAEEERVAGDQVQLIHKMAALLRALIPLQVEKVMQLVLDISQAVAAVALRH